ncbi:flippase [Vibrio vulnificus]|nr:flippase [Vibrio vulnificus]
MFRRSSSFRKVITNIFSLGGIQLANSVLPIVIFPYLIRVLGISNFGLLMLVQAVMLYIQVFVDYGFNLSAVSYLAKNNSNARITQRTFSNVITIRLTIAIISLIVLTLAVFTFDVDNRELYILSFGNVLGNVLISSWFFQAKENMKYIAIMNFSLRCISLLLIVTFINKEADLIFYPIINSACSLIIGGISIFVIFKKYKIKYEFPSRREVIYFIKSGYYIFLSQLQVTLFNNTNVLILGYYQGSTQVGLYSAVEKIIRAFAMLQGPITGAIFPLISRKFAVNKSDAVKILKYVTVIGVLGYLIVISLSLLFNIELIRAFTGRYDKELIQIFYVICTVPIAVFLNNIAGTQIMINLGYKKEFMKILMLSGVISLMLCNVLSANYGSLGTAITLFFVEWFIAISMWAFVINKRIVQ